MKIGNSIFLLLLGSAFHLTIYSQTKTNFELVDSLINESVLQILTELDSDRTYELNFFGSEEYSVLEERIKYHLRNKGIVLSENDTQAESIYYTLTEARTEYSDLFQDGLFGDYLIERNISLNIFYHLGDTGKEVDQKEISASTVDTVIYSDFSKIENVAYPFASAELPEEPLFSSTLEPIIAIGTAAVAVYLFFNIRSK